MWARIETGFRKKLEEILRELSKKGYNYELYRGYVTPQVQAILFTRSRSAKEIEEAASQIIKEGAPTVARLIREAKALPGKRETDLLPGQCWHQYGEAVKLRLIGPEGRVIWAQGHFGYEVLARTAQSYGLASGFFWKRRDVNHLQLKDVSVRSQMSWKEIDLKVQKDLSK